MPELRRSTRLAPTGEAPAAKKAKIEATEEKHISKPSKTKPEATKTDKEAATKTEDDEKPSKKIVEIQEGDDVPDLTLLDENSEEVSLKEIALKSKFLVIFAYPRASTPGCTRQACGFSSNYDEFKKLDAQVYGLSGDSPKAQLNFVTKQGLKFPLLSDPKRELIAALGAKKPPSGVKRSHWIFVDGKLKIKKIQISPEVSITSALKDVQELA